MVTPERPRPLPDHEIWRIACVTRYHFSGDWMHGFDLGATSYAHASVIHEFLAPDGPFAGAGDWNQRLNSIWCAITATYDTLGVHKRLTNLTPGMVRGKKPSIPALGLQGQ